MKWSDGIERYYRALERELRVSDLIDGCAGAAQDLLQDSPPTSVKEGRERVQSTFAVISELELEAMWGEQRGDRSVHKYLFDLKRISSFWKITTVDRQPTTLSLMRKVSATLPEAIQRISNQIIEELASAHELSIPKWMSEMNRRCGMSWFNSEQKKKAEKKASQKSSVSPAPSKKSAGGSTKCTFCHNAGHQNSDCRFLANFRKQGACFNCGYRGHVTGDCPQPPRAKGVVPRIWSDEKSGPGRS